jgi:hypothetical protein
MLDRDPEEPVLPLTAALPAPAEGVPVTPVVCDPSPAVIGAIAGALLSLQPEFIAAIQTNAIPNTCALFITRRTLVQNNGVSNLFSASSNSRAGLKRVVHMFVSQTSHAYVCVSSESYTRLCLVDG